MGETVECDTCVLRAPHFFKVLMENSRDQLIIPPAFAHRIKRESSHAILESLAVKNWPVELTGDGNRLVFQRGWKEFFDFHSLGMGDFLVFRYNGRMRFSIRVFGRICCEDSYAPTEMDFEITRHLRKPVRLSSRFPTPSYKNAAGVEQRRPTSGKVVRKAHLEASPQSNTSLSSNPSFKVVIRRHVSGLQKYVHIPIEFGRRLGKLAPSTGSPQRTTVTLTVCDGSTPGIKVFNVRLLHRIRYSRASVYILSGGWTKFCEDNMLKAGDKCTFELNSERSGINVYINRHEPKRDHSCAAELEPDLS